MWSPTHFPSAMRSLNSSTRVRAIEIANELLASGRTDKQQVVVASIDQARTWMRCQVTEATLSGSMFHSQAV